MCKKFKVGDKVKVVKKITDKCAPYWAGGMSDTIDKIGEVIDVSGDDRIELKFSLPSTRYYSYWYDSRSLENLERTSRGFSKSDLRSGMIVEDRRGKRALVIIGESEKDFVSDGSSCENTFWCPFSNYTEELTRVGDESTMSDIVKVYAKESNVHGGNLKVVGKLLWKEEIKEHSLEELKEIIGYDFKLIN